MNAAHLVSCVMPTCNRRPFVKQAVAYFMRQDYAARELIIVDDGEDAVGDLIADDERIRYVRLEQRMPLAAKRNLACRLAEGTVIAHWDDDDWMAPDRLRLQVEQLLGTGAGACGVRDLLHYHMAAGQAWTYSPPARLYPWLAAGTLCYRREVWMKHPFAEDDHDHIGAFLRQLGARKVHAMPDSAFYVGLIHNGNHQPVNLADSCWRRRPLDDLGAMFKEDRDFYINLRRAGAQRRKRPRNGQAAATGRSTAGRFEVTVAAPYLIYDGYGSMAEYLVRGMQRAGARVSPQPLVLDKEGLTDDFIGILRAARPHPEAPLLYFCWPRPDFDRFCRKPDLFIYTMWEGSRLPPGWAGYINRTRAAIAPTRFVAQVFRDSGVTVPVEVVQQGIDPNVYSYIERPERAGLTTLIVGTVIARKNVREGVAAWKKAFADDPEARLIIKSRFRYGNFVPDDPRIEFVDDNETTRGIAHWYRQADVLLALGNEGFGLPLVEAMATGLPVVALRSEGQGDVCEDADGLMLPVPPAQWVEMNTKPYGPGGVRGVPDPAVVADRLRWVATHRDEARAMGRAAAAWTLEHRNVWTMGPRMLDVMERYARRPRPLRRAYTLWVPSWGQPCGIAQYTASVAERLPDARIASEVPSPEGLRVLHVQHEHALFNGSDLARQIRRARQAGVPVVVTEHSVFTRAKPWEREADVLVSLTPQGTQRLRTRWPKKRVEHIPHGCPTWFPPRKKRRGRTIGVFGFLEPHKGFWELLDVLRRLPGTDLYMVSHARTQAVESRWEAAAAGLPVRREQAYLSEAEAARRLAAEADVLVYWYDEKPHASASGAVRIGLATGVPVLTSPTGWFEDVQDVTYQPGDLVEGVRRLLRDQRLRKALSGAAFDYCHQHSWARIRQRHLALWRTLENT